MTFFNFVLLTVTLVTSVIDTKIYNRCELAQELRERFKFSESELPKWLCLIFWESSYDTEALHRGNWDGSSDHGLFQINDRYWCEPSDGKLSANVCNVSCSKLRDNDIADDVRCALKIYEVHNFTAWVAFTQKCTNSLEEFSKPC